MLHHVNATLALFMDTVEKLLHELLLLLQQCPQHLQANLPSK